MGMSKVYRGYVIEDVNGQYYIHNAPNFTNGVPFSPGPHGGWTVATHQVDILINHMNREQNTNSGKYVSQPSYDDGGYSSSDTVKVKYEDTLNSKDRETFLEIKADYHNLSDKEFEKKWNRNKEYVLETFPAVLSTFESFVYGTSVFVFKIIGALFVGFLFMTILKVFGWLFL